MTRRKTSKTRNPVSGELSRDDHAIERSGSGRFTQKDIPESDSEWIHLAEQASLKESATGLIKTHRRLLNLFSGRRSQDHSSKTRRISGRRLKKIPISIDTENLESDVKRLFEEEQIYLTSGLSLAGLAREIDIEPYLLSRFLNIHLKTSFNDLVNIYRVNRAKALLAGDEFKTVLDIAFDSGFNSKASFNRIFRKTTGLTPSQYRRTSRSS